MFKAKPRRNRSGWHALKPRRISGFLERNPRLVRLIDSRSLGPAYSLVLRLRFYMRMSCIGLSQGCFGQERDWQSPTYSEFGVCVLTLVRFPLSTVGAEDGLASPA